MSTTETTFVTIPSFEARSLVALKSFIEGGGSPASIHLAKMAKDSPELATTMSAVHDLYPREVPTLDRFSSRDLWRWTWDTLGSATGEVTIDATCVPRELLGMLLFALSVRREYVDSARVCYVPPSSHGYATQSEGLPKEDRWLSKGVREIRSIIGYPGDFLSDRRRHVIALAGHEGDRLLEVLEYLEPDELSLSSERGDSSTVEGAADWSQRVALELRDKIPVPEINDLDFSAQSITETFESLSRLLATMPDRNVTLVAMNTKLSFVGAALGALHDRSVRIVYAVPDRYNPKYSVGGGPIEVADITELIKGSATIPAQTPLAR